MTMQSPQRKKRGFLTVLSYDARIIAKVWILVPWFIICLAINAVVWAFIDSIAVYFRNAMFNALDAGGAFWDVARYILALAIFSRSLSCCSFFMDAILSAASFCFFSARAILLASS